ncbi:MAG: hypothetical protein AB1651_13815 [Pseudomonadota bacterium]
MALDEPQLRQIAALVAAAASLRDAAAALRSTFPGLRAIVVDALDVKGEPPAFEVGDRGVYLVEDGGHCWSLTRDPGSASGVMLVQG